VTNVGPDPKEVELPLSARLLGHLLGLTAMEVNLLLLHEGILEGEPGVYGLTDKGREYAGERYVETGPRSGYDLTTYDPKIIDDLDTSRERLQQVRAEASAIRRDRREIRKANAIDLWPNSPRNPDNQNNVSSEGVDPHVVVAVIVVVGAAAYGIWKAAPRVRKMWKDRTMRGEAGPGQHDPPSRFPDETNQR